MPSNKHHRQQTTTTESHVLTLFYCTSLFRKLLHHAALWSIPAFHLYYQQQIQWEPEEVWKSKLLKCELRFTLLGCLASETYKEKHVHSKEAFLPWSVIWFALSYPNPISEFYKSIFRFWTEKSICYISVLTVLDMSPFNTYPRKGTAQRDAW